MKTRSNPRTWMTALVALFLLNMPCFGDVVDVYKANSKNALNGAMDGAQHKKVDADIARSLPAGFVRLANVFTPPGNRKFAKVAGNVKDAKRYSAIPNYVDFYEDHALKIVALPDGPGMIKAQADFPEPKVAGVFPLRCEGNFENTQGTGGGSSNTTQKEDVWRAHVKDRYFVYLTFDDGPLGGTDDCIDILNQEKVMGTFFMVGAHVTTTWRKNQVTAAQAGGHPIANHSFSHWHQSTNYDTGKTNAQWLTDFRQNDTKLSVTLGTTQTFTHARLPGKNAWRVGTINVDDGNSKRVADHLSTNGYVIYGWDYEWQSGGSRQTPDRMVQETRARLLSGQTRLPRKIIILTHDVMFRESQGTKADLQKYIQGLKNLSDITIEFKGISTYLTD